MPAALPASDSASGTALYRPAGRFDPSTALAPYTGSWNARFAAHLLRRAGFGGSPADVARLAGMPMQRAVDAMMHFPDTSALAPLPAFEPVGYAFEQQMAQLRRAQRAAARGFAPAQPVASIPQDQIDLQRKNIRRARVMQIATLMQWWLQRMVATPAPLQEKMTLFWHGHFTSAVGKGNWAPDMANQNQLFRSQALGNAAALTLAVSQDPAMLRYLDNTTSVKAHPNENYARELMELFTLGIGNYTETDVREGARAFTGWRTNRDGFYFDRANHDDGSKTFLGRTGNFDGKDIVDIIFAQPAAAKFFATKLISFFVYSDPEPAFVDAFAAVIRKNNFELAPSLSTLFRSNVFYSARAYRALVKSPVEFIVGTYQLFGLPTVDITSVVALNRMGQRLFYPPNVKGWDGGAAWLSSQTILTRENIAGALAANPMTMRAPWITSGAGPNALDPTAMAHRLTDAMLVGDVSPASMSRLVGYLNGDGVTALGKLSGENVDERVRGAAYLAMAMPAYQLN